jgi:hypothetical protein
LGDEHSYSPSQQPDSNQESDASNESDANQGSDSWEQSDALIDAPVSHDEVHSHDEDRSQHECDDQHEDLASPNDFSSPTAMAPQLLNEPEMVVVEETIADIGFAEPGDVESQPEPEPFADIRVSEPAPLVAAASSESAGDSTKELLGLPLQFLNQLLQKLGSTKLDSLADLIPAARLVGIALLAGVALKITGATLGAINDIPVVGGLLELIGLVSMLNFLARNALKQQKRAELLSRIRKLKQDFLN